METVRAESLVICSLISCFQKMFFHMFDNHFDARSGFLLDNALSRTFQPSKFCFDPMRIFYQTGVASTAVGLIRRELSKGGYRPSDIFENYSSREFAGFTCMAMPRQPEIFSSE